ncbi:MAG TPA: metallophosphoesterase family protein [Thermomicrobiales bacterium]|jgi:predicted phosphodiesterase
MRIALFSDVHGNLTALRAVLAALERHRPLQMIVVAGDHVLAGPRPAETWDALQAAGCTCILGNEDVRLWDNAVTRTIPDSPWEPLVAVVAPWTVAALGPARMAALRALPTSLRVIPAPDLGLLVVHANIHDLTGWALKADTSDDDLARLYGGAHARVVCCGHYHAACVREWGGMTLVNVASVSLPTGGEPYAGYTILDWDGAWHIAQFRIPYDADAEAAAMAAATIPKSVPGWSPPSSPAPGEFA